jgi:hypothetical protein
VWQADYPQADGAHHAVAALMSRLNMPVTAEAFHHA